MKDEYRNKLRCRIANSAIGPSTIRGMAKKGTIAPARLFLAQIDLSKFINCDAEEFAKLLDGITEQYRNEVKLHWGTARKFLNIFLRDCLYNRWVCEDFQLSEIGQFFEVPLDSHVARELKQKAGRGKLPRWRGVSRLDAPQSKQFQNYADKLAKSEGVWRVDLDIIFWRGDLSRRKQGI
ncbi:hypothetical protein [Amantichitinum ursilacus]|uniref:hypothetical protein n=1 Tax=Amantichitinum ursilacus TaxID=857265 RepID=UPI00128F1331|nr:hypothetical protein [Amantichitinum ursilacus]